MHRGGEEERDSNRLAPPPLPVIAETETKHQPKQNGCIVGHSGEVSSVQRADRVPRHPEVQPPLLPTMYRGLVERRPERAVPLSGVEV